VLYNVLPVAVRPRRDVSIPVRLAQRRRGDGHGGASPAPLLDLSQLARLVACRVGPSLGQIATAVRRISFSLEGDGCHRSGAPQRCQPRRRGLVRTHSPSEMDTARLERDMGVGHHILGAGALLNQHAVGGECGLGHHISLILLQSTSGVRVGPHVMSRRPTRGVSCSRLGSRHLQVRLASTRDGGSLWLRRMAAACRRGRAVLVVGRIIFAHGQWIVVAAGYVGCDGRAAARTRARGRDGGAQLRETRLRLGGHLVGRRRTRDERLVGLLGAGLLGGQGDGELAGFLASLVEGMWAVNAGLVLVVGEVASAEGLGLVRGSLSRGDWGEGGITNPGRSPRPERGSTGGVRLASEPVRNLRATGRSMAMGRLCRGEFG